MKKWTKTDEKYVKEYLAGVYGRTPTKVEVREALKNWI